MHATTRVRTPQTTAAVKQDSRYPGILANHALTSIPSQTSPRVGRVPTETTSSGAPHWLIPRWDDGAWVTTV
ncbi:hypothetical protein HBH56_078770 [Parastagonospora nodorum]|nr:hypothetical protein HBH56_078770 [Parastagonospora nodorum]KAH4570748.1 hypothetical protein HBH84_117290 [Parastagonospora nodorum]KAH4644666.1 hypothetical protein HBH81_065080 [Parastagonospora nodorum]KAH5471158.1 hypothetical protein HBI31_195910 [Parastagonospora nodorum]KAH5603515.1 hypothetical protein HBI45_122350 [Parastagonospora nodorum]